MCSLYSRPPPMLSMGVLQHQQPTATATAAVGGASSVVIQVLEAVDASASAGSQREREKAWIKERLARKRSVAERELQQDRQELQQHQRQPAQSSPSSPAAPAVRVVCVCPCVCLLRCAESSFHFGHRMCVCSECIMFPCGGARVG